MVLSVWDLGSYRNDPPQTLQYLSIVTGVKQFFDLGKGQVFSCSSCAGATRRSCGLCCFERKVSSYMCRSARGRWTVCRLDYLSPTLRRSSILTPSFPPDFPLRILAAAPELRRSGGVKLEVEASLQVEFLPLLTSSTTVGNRSTLD